MSTTKEMNRFDIADMVIEMGRDIIKKQKGNVSPKEWEDLQIRFNQTLLIANKIIDCKSKL